MSHAAQSHHVTVGEFYAWVSSRLEDRYELVNGEIVAMAGANRRHDRIVTTALRLVGNALLGHPCGPFSSDTYIAIPQGNRRQPDMGVDCGAPDDNSLEADKPTLVVEVLSPTTRSFDITDKVEEYKSVPSLAYIVLIDADYAQVRVYRREPPERNWESHRLTGLDAVISLPLLGIGLQLSDLYAGLEFRPRPTLVSPTEADSKLAI